MMKQVAVGRTTWLFIGSISTGRQAANLITLVSGASRNDLDVWIYTKSVLDAPLSDSPDYASLRPDTWRSYTPSTSAATEWRNVATEPTASSVSEPPAEPPNSPAP